MSESYTNREVHRNVQLKCSSEINPSIKYNSDCNDYVMENMLLPLDLTDSRCDRVGFKKILDRDGYNNECDDLDISNKHSVSINYKITEDTVACPNKETSPALSLSNDTSTTIKRSMSSAFMISSLLSTTTVSSFSTVISQANSGKHSSDLKLTSSASSCAPVSSGIGRISHEVRQKFSEVLSNSLHKLDNSHSSKCGLQKESYQEILSGQKSSTQLEEHSLMDVNDGSDNEKDLRDTNKETKARSQTAKYDNFLTMSDSEVDDKIVEEKSMWSVKEMQTVKTISSKTSDNYSTSHSRGQDMLGKCGVAATHRHQHFTDEDELFILEDSYRRNSGSSNIDLDANNKIRNGRTSGIVSGSTDSICDSFLVDSGHTDRNKEKVAAHFITKNDQSKHSKTASNNLDTKKHINNTVDFSGVEYSKNIDNQNQFALDYSSFESKTNNDNWNCEKNFGVEKWIKDPPDYKKYSFNQLCDSKDSNASHFLGDETNSSSGIFTASDSNIDEPISYVLEKSPDISSLETFSDRDRNKSSVFGKSDHMVLSAHSNKLLDDDEKHFSSSSFHETKLDHTQMKLSDVSSKNDVCMEAKKSHRQDHCINQDMKDKYGVDNHSRTSEDVNSNVKKYSFKNILLMPKEKVTSNLNYATKKDTESAETMQNKHLITGSSTDEKSEEEQSAKAAVGPLLGDNSSCKMEVTESASSNESVSDRKRCQPEEIFSASKRSRFVSTDNKDDTKFKEATSDASNNVAHVDKQVVNTDSNKQNGITLSNEALQSLITLRARAFIKNQKQNNLDRLNLRTRGMQSASNLWKETAKHLERSVLELAALNQKLESRKAHFLAVKRLASKSIGIQAGEENSSPSSVSNVQTVPSTQRNSPTSAQSPVQRNRPGRPPNSSRLVANIPPTTPHERKIPPTGSKTPDTQVNSVNLIDLTDDEEISKNIIVKPSTPQSHLVSHKQTTPGNGYVQPPVMNVTSKSSHQIIQATNSGSQLPPSYNSSSTTPESLVITNSSTLQNPSLAIASIPTGQKATTTTNINLTSAATDPSPTSALTLPPSFLISNNHPAPLPSNMDSGNAPPTAKNRPPKPSLKISRVSQGIVLSWNMPSLTDVEKITSYQLYAYQESDSLVPKSNLWKKVGEVKSLPLPMACTLTQFQEGNKYHFAVRAVDQYGRWGSYSDPSSVYLGKT